MLTDLDRFWMARALREAERGRGSVEPNPMVGAIAVKDGRLVGVGRHERFGGPHAEVWALQEAGDLARGSTLYVSLEPCSHFGKTPPCADLIVASGVARTVVAMEDPFPKVRGRGLEKLREAGISVEVGLLRDRAIALNAPYLKRLATGKPYVTAKWAMTLDGKIACSSGDSQWISGARSRELVHELRGRMDAVIVGIDTVLRDDPRLTARGISKRTPARIVLDSSARTPETARVVASARETPTLIAVSRRAEPARVESLRRLGVEVLSLDSPDRPPVDALLAELGSRGMTNVLVEGGGRVLGSFGDAGQIDEVEVYIATGIEGGSHGRVPMAGRGITEMRNLARLRDVSIETVDGDVRVRGRLTDPRELAGSSRT